MARTLAQVRKQIEKLQTEADRLKANEAAGVVQRIKTAIDFYGLTAEDLFGSGPKVTAEGKKVVVKKVKKTPAPAKYRDKTTGRTWTGHGKRPGWFVEAIEGGIKAEEMAV